MQLNLRTCPCSNSVWIGAVRFVAAATFGGLSSLHFYPYRPSSRDLLRCNLFGETLFYIKLFTYTLYM